MQEYDVLPMYATPFTQVALPFTQVALPFTHGSKELRHIVCGHCLPHVDTSCLTRSTKVDIAGMLQTQSDNIWEGAR